MVTPHKITPNLWFDTQAEEAVEFYTTVFENSRIKSTSRYGKEGREVHGMPEGTAMTVAFELERQPFLALNGGPQFTFSEAISFVVSCESQAEVDHYWERLSEGGDEKAQVCGWLKDRFGVSWQIVPKGMDAMLNGSDREGAQRAMTAMLAMKKLDLEGLRSAYEGR